MHILYSGYAHFGAMYAQKILRICLNGCARSRRILYQARQPGIQSTDRAANSRRIIVRTMAQALPQNTQDPQVLALRVPPHSIEAEQSVLGGLLLDNQAWERIGDMLSVSDFYRDDHRRIYRHIARLIDEAKPA